MKIALALLSALTLPLIGCSEPSQTNILHGYCSDVYPVRVNSVVNKLAIYLEKLEKLDTTTTKTKHKDEVSEYIINKSVGVYRRDVAAEFIIKTGEEEKISCEKLLNHLDKRIDSLNIEK